MRGRQSKVITDYLAQFAESQGIDEDFRLLIRQNDSPTQLRAKTVVPRPINMSSHSHSAGSGRLHVSGNPRSKLFLSSESVEQEDREAEALGQPTQLLRRFNSLSADLLARVEKHREYYEFKLYQINKQLESGAGQVKLSDLYLLRQVQLLGLAKAVAGARSKYLVEPSCLHHYLFLSLKLISAQAKLRQQCAMQILKCNFRRRMLRPVFKGWRKVISSQSEQNEQVKVLKFSRMVTLLRGLFKQTLHEGLMLIKNRFQREQCRSSGTVQRRWSQFKRRVLNQNIPQELVCQQILDSSLFCQVQPCQTERKRQQHIQQFTDYKLTPSRQADPSMPGSPVIIIPNIRSQLFKIREKINIAKERGNLMAAVFWEWRQVLLQGKQERNALRAYDRRQKCKVLRGLSQQLLYKGTEVLKRRVGNLLDAQLETERQNRWFIQDGKKGYAKPISETDLQLMANGFKGLQLNHLCRKKQRQLNSKYKAKASQTYARTILGKCFAVLRTAALKQSNRKEAVLSFKLRRAKSLRTKAFFYLRVNAEQQGERGALITDMFRRVRDKSTLQKAFSQLCQNRFYGLQQRLIETRADQYFYVKLMRKYFISLRLVTMHQGRCRRLKSERDAKEEREEQFGRQSAVLLKVLRVWKSYTLKKRAYRMFIARYRQLKQEELKRKVVQHWKRRLLERTTSRNQPAVEPRRAGSKHQTWLNSCYEDLLCYEQALSQA